MVQADIVQEQLRRIGVNFRFWNKPELKELPKVLLEGEEINHVVSGHYEGGFAILVSTDLRVILIDKKPLFLTLEDIRYERISDVELNHRLLDATLRLGALTKNLSFTGYNPAKMREMTSYIQEKVMASRQDRQASTYQPQPSTAYATTPAPIAYASQATDSQKGAIGQVAVTSVDDAENPSVHEQLIHAISVANISSQDEAPFTPAQNPYRQPPAFRRRVSRFY